MNALPYVKHAPPNKHREAWEACREPSDADRLSAYLHSLAREFDPIDHNARTQAGNELKRRLAEHWHQRDEAANEH